MQEFCLSKMMFVVPQALLRFFYARKHQSPHSTLDGQTPDAAYFKQPLLAAV